MSSEILKNIIQDFSSEKILHFFRQKNRSFRSFFEEAFQYCDNDFSDCLHIGEIEFDNISRLVVYAFKVNRDLTERSGKRAQYEKGKRILREKNADAGIFIFYDDNNRFRFSLITTEYLGTRRQFSHFKRFTYFVSPEETNKTFLQRIGDGDFSSLESIKEAFSAEKVTKEFYQEIANWYFWALREVRFPHDAESEPNGRNIALIRLITRLIFIWFMRQKGIVKKELFDKKFLEGILKDLSDKEGTYYKAILQNLFFATLNTPIEQRKFRREERYKGYLNKDYMNHTYFRHHNLFKEPEKIKELFNDIPFLNGGLFECLDKAKDDESNDTDREIRIDGFSDDPKKQPHVLNFLFFSEERDVDLNEDYGTKNKRYRVRGLINILSSYNFTIDENTPVDEEVALDPELLGRVFENLLASYNPETATTARKSTGSYYTPREIVDYMVRESLLEYFKQHLTPKNSPPAKGEYPKGEGVLNNSPPAKGEYPKGEGVKIYNKPEFKFFRRELRKNLTPAEAKLWTLLQGRQLEGRKFRRQHSVGNYVLDFYCPEEKLAVELDGEGHFTTAGAEYDAERDAFIEQFGIKVLRFENKWVWDNPEGLLEELKRNFGWSKQPLSPSDSSPLQGGKPLSPSDSSPLQGEQLLEERLRILFAYDDDQHDFNEEEVNELINAIHNLKLLDPAVGSGAFPMGALHTLVHILHKLDPHNERWKEEQIKATSHITDPKIRQETIQRIEESFTLNELDYGRKLYLIQNCLYGVDIQPIAIQIAKLRFFISLLVDEKVDRTKPNFGIEPLPNLETKFVAANTLIGLPRPKQLNLMPPVVKELEERLKEIRNEYFIATTTKEKERLKKKDRELRNALAQMLRESGFPSEATEKIASWNPYDTNNSADWFEPEWMFGVNEGFDVVIGNPPYVQLQKNSGVLANLYKDKGFETFERTGDIYALFYEKGINLLKKDGHLCLITSNKWMRAGYGQSLRKFFTKYNPKILIDLGPGIFESATVDTNILLIQKSENKNQLKAVTLKKQENINIENQLKEQGVILNKLTKDPWFIGSSAEQRLKEKIERLGKPLKDWDVNIYRGVLTGLNEAFIITTEKRDEILANCKDEDERTRTSAIIKPILRGRDIKRYYYEWAGLWVIGTFPALHLDIDKYPALKKYFLDNFDIKQLEQSGKKYPELGFDARKKTGNKWFETQDQIAYYPEFEKEKVVWAETDHALNTVIVPKGIYLQKTCFMIIASSPKLISAYLNSNLSQWIIRKSSSNLGEKGMSLTKESVQKIPLLPITTSNEPIVRQIEALVDKILTAKKQNPQSDTNVLEREIDNLVYKLYDLTEEEIKIIENKA